MLHYIDWSTLQISYIIDNSRVDASLKQQLCNFLLFQSCRDVQCRVSILWIVQTHTLPVFIYVSEQHDNCLDSRLWYNKSENLLSSTIDTLPVGRYPFLRGSGPTFSITSHNHACIALVVTAPQCGQTAATCHNADTVAGQPIYVAH